MYSDNGTNFTGASKELKEVVSHLDHQKVNDFATALNIVWKFNPPSAPHMGGAWERLVRSVKEILTAIMKDRVLTDPQLYTLVTEVESTLNSRPLTHFSDDVTDLEPLTPNHILLGLHRNWGYMCDTDDKDVISRKKWRQVQAAANAFWRRWKTEYLPKLTKRSRWQSEVPNFEVGN